MNAISAIHTEAGVSEVALKIETFPDAANFAALPPVTPDRNLRDPEKIKKNLGDKKQRQLAHAALDARFAKIVCVCLYGCADTGDAFEHTIFDRCEKRLIAKFWNVARTLDCFITFNGVEFDVPFLMKRSWFAGIVPSVAIAARRRGPSNHVDIRMVLNDWDRHAPGTLEEYAHIKLDERPSRVSAAEMHSSYRAGDYARIKEQCLIDAIIIWRL
jgi:hypothetical protein